MNEQIDRIQAKVNLLKSRDPEFKAFGSERHQYQFNKPKTEQELLDFEQANAISLPSGYREFLNQVGNGGAGPYYGLQPLENGRFADLDYRNEEDLNDLSLPFPLTEAWNLDFDHLKDDIEDEDEYYAQKDEEYFQNKWANGLLRISNFGCGVSYNLVVNGPEYGNIWVDDRCNDGGIYPDPYTENNGRIQFLDWYESWLDKELKKLEA